MRNSRLHLFVFTDTPNEVLDEWMPELFYRVVESVFLDSGHDYGIATRVLFQLMALSHMDSLEIPLDESDVFEGAHPNQFFIHHQMHIGSDVIYRTSNLGSSHPRPFCVQTLIHDVPLVDGFGTSLSAARLDNLNNMRASPQMLQYCREVKAAHLSLFSIPHDNEILGPQDDPEAYLLTHFQCSKWKLDSYFRVVELSPDILTSQNGLLIRVVRFLSIFYHQEEVKSLYLHRSKIESRRRNMLRFGASLYHGIPIDRFICADHPLFSPPVLKALVPYYPALPFPPALIERYILKDGYPQSSPIFRATPPTVVDGETAHNPPFKRPHLEKFFVIGKKFQNIYIFSKLHGDPLSLIHYLGFSGAHPSLLRWFFPCVHTFLLPLIILHQLLSLNICWFLRPHTFF